MKLTEKEEDLIEQIRNYRRAYPNGRREMEILIFETVYDLIEKDE